MKKIILALIILSSSLMALEGLDNVPLIRGSSMIQIWDGSDNITIENISDMECTAILRFGTTTSTGYTKLYYGEAKANIPSGTVIFAKAKDCTVILSLIKG